MNSIQSIVLAFVLIILSQQQLLSQDYYEVEPNNELLNNCNPIIGTNGVYIGNVPYSSGDIDIWKIQPGASGTLSFNILILPDGSQIERGLYESDDPQDLGNFIAAGGDYELLGDKYYFLYTEGLAPIIPGASNYYSWYLDGNAFDCLECLPEGITFLEQTEIDNFQLNFPSCVNILGNVEIYGNQIVDLNGLNVLLYIGGNLFIDSTSLQSLTGLNNLVSVNGTLYIANNLLLYNLSGLEHLAYIGENLMFYNNLMLSSTAGLSSLSILGGDLGFIENPSLEAISGFEHLNEINGNLGVLGNPNLSDLSGLGNLMFIDGMFSVIFNNSLTSLNGLESLICVSGFLEINSNSSLVTLSGIDNINPNSISYLTISNNSSLSTCEVESICDYLAGPNGNCYISGNAEGCNNQAQILEACLTSSLEEYNIEDEISLFPNPAKNKITVIVNGESQIEEMIIYNRLGQKVLVGRLENNSMDISELHQGIYIIEVVLKNWKNREILIVE